jgi:hypothetical protein
MLVLLKLFWSFYYGLIPHGHTPFPWRSIWWNNVPLRMVFFAWSAVLGKILTMDNLGKRHIIVLDGCRMCKMSGESVDHLLHCEIAGALWNSIFNLFGLHWVMLRRVVDLFASWKGQFSGPHCAAMLVSSCLMWCIWRDWNDWSFEDCKKTTVELKPFTNGRLHRVVFIFLAFVNFLIFFLLLVRCFSCILWLRLCVF